jgi:hypothetical protein
MLTCNFLLSRGKVARSTQMATVLEHSVFIPDKSMFSSLGEQPYFSLSRPIHLKTHPSNQLCHYYYGAGGTSDTLTVID